MSGDFGVVSGIGIVMLMCVCLRRDCHCQVDDKITVTGMNTCAVIVCVLLIMYVCMYVLLLLLL